MTHLKCENTLRRAVSGFKISRIQGPSAILNGSVPLLVLDCQYDASRYDTQGLTVKWYLKNRMGDLVYQWIPNTAPQDLSILKGRLDLSYRVSNHSDEMYRALAIKRPTTEHSGEYTCVVSTFHGDDHKTKTVIVYSPATDIYVTYSRPSVAHVKVVCGASGVFPEPKLDIFRSGGNFKSSKMATKSTSEFVNAFGSYNTTVFGTVLESDLQDETVFECRLSIPGTDYRLQENMLYYPGENNLEQ
ncbi:Immunoglobulin-like domain [Trinorchestia longiramus]|nr:Immunoglobulin-like domain [Trinorchestia longiramus]